MLGETERGWNQNIKHLRQISERGGVFERMRRVGVKETAAVGAKHFDRRLLRSNRPIGKALFSAWRVVMADKPTGFAVRLVDGKTAR